MQLSFRIRYVHTSQCTPLLILLLTPLITSAWITQPSVTAPRHGLAGWLPGWLPAWLADGVDACLVGAGALPESLGCLSQLRRLEACLNQFTGESTRSNATVTQVG